MYPQSPRIRDLLGAAFESVVATVLRMWMRAAIWAVWLI